MKIFKKIAIYSFLFSNILPLSPVLVSAEELTDNKIETTDLQVSMPEENQTSDSQGSMPEENQTSDSQGSMPEENQTSDSQGSMPEENQTSDSQVDIPEKKIKSYDNQKSIEIDPRYVANNFDINIDGVEVIPGAWFDIPSLVQGKYLADNIRYFVNSYTLDLVNQETQESRSFDHIGSEFSFDVSGLKDGIYYGTITAHGYFSAGTVQTPQYWQSSFIMETKSTDATVHVDKLYNPSSIELTFKGDSNIWSLKDETGRVIASGSGNFDSSILQTLEEGMYTIENTASATTTNGTVVPPTTAKDVFYIRHPQSTTTIDRPINPGSISGGQKIPESALTWVIKDDKGEVIKEGDGANVPKEVIDELPEGKYSAEFTETSPEGETSISQDDFSIRHPQSTTTIDRPINPGSISGGQKIPESDLTWVIKDDKGEVIKEGDGANVPKEVIDELPEGKYSAEFTETSPEGETSISQDDFSIRHPQSTTTIDRPINPGSISGGQKIPESDLTWVIKDDKGEVIKEGDGANVPKEVIDELPEGKYSAEFTETSP
ncbi:hypothetical protein ACWN6Y_07980, partial [Vagococcus teuberi]